MNERQLPTGILLTASLPHPESSGFDCSRYTWIAIDKLSINDLLIDNIPGAPPPENTPNKQSMNRQQPDLTCSPDPTNTQADGQVVRVDNAGGKAYGKATELYNQHQKYSE